MFRPNPEFFMGGLCKIVYKLNLNPVMVQELNYHSNENVYNKPNIQNGL